MTSSKNGYRKSAVSVEKWKLIKERCVTAWECDLIVTRKARSRLTCQIVCKTCWMSSQWSLKAHRWQGHWLTTNCFLREMARSCTRHKQRSSTLWWREDHLFRNVQDQMCNHQFQCCAHEWKVQMWWTGASQSDWWSISMAPRKRNWHWAQMTCNAWSGMSMPLLQFIPISRAMQEWQWPLDRVQCNQFHASRSSTHEAAQKQSWLESTTQQPWFHGQNYLWKHKGMPLAKMWCI